MALHVKRGKRRKKMAPSSSIWNSTPDLIMHLILSKLPLRAQKQCRLVSKHWYYQINGQIEAVQLSKLHISKLHQRFPGLVRIDLSGCKKLRDHSLQVLAASELQIQELKLGGQAPGVQAPFLRVSDRGMRAIAGMTTLKKLTLAYGYGITDVGIAKLSSLTRLEELSLMTFFEITEAGMKFLQGLPMLKSLTILWCSGETRNLLGVIGPMPNLQRLHLKAKYAHTLTQADLETLWNVRDTKLVELILKGFTLSTDFPLGLAQYKSLRALGIASGHGIIMEMTSDMLQKLTNLEHLTLCIKEKCTDRELLAFSKSLKNLQYLKIELSIKATSKGIGALATLPDLQACSFTCSDAFPAALEGISTLTGLNHAELPGCTISPELLSAMPHMTNLQSLSVCGHPKTETVGADLVESILGCLSLRLLDLSFKTISLEVVGDLLSKLVSRDEARSLHRPVLEELYLHSCGLKVQDFEDLSRSFPAVFSDQGHPSALTSWIGGSKTASMI